MISVFLGSIIMRGLFVQIVLIVCCLSWSQSWCLVPTYTTVRQINHQYSSLCKNEYDNCIYDSCRIGGGCLNSGRHRNNGAILTLSRTRLKSRSRPIPSHNNNNNNNNNNKDKNNNNNKIGNDDHDDDVGIRLNKCFRSTHSRRQADALIEAGRVTVNGEVGTPGQRVFFGQDVVALDGQDVSWQELNVIPNPTPNSTTKKNNSSSSSNTPFSYIKYWKPRGVTCTTDLSIRSNIIHALQQSLQAGSSYHDNNNNIRGFRPKNRVFTVGRLDKDSSGLIFLTSDGRLPNAISRSQFKRPKVYQVTVDRALRQRDIQHLRDGVVITTIAQRDRGVQKPLTAPTQPCDVIQTSRHSFQITLMEGRNRQIRKMCQALGYSVRTLHRVEVNGITLDRLTPGTWDYLSKNEMSILNTILQSYNPKQHHKQ